MLLFRARQAIRLRNNPPPPDPDESGDSDSNLSDTTSDASNTVRPEQPNVSSPELNFDPSLDDKYTKSTSDGPSAQKTEQPSASPPEHLFDPSHDDVHAVRRLFKVCLRLPVELADMIIDSAEYFPSIASHKDETIGCSATGVNRNVGSVLYLLSDPIPTAREGHDELVRIRNVTFRITSRDQGWGGERRGTYICAYSWLDACIYRPRGEVRGEIDAPTGEQMAEIADWDDDASDLGLDRVEHAGEKVWKVQMNKVADREWKHYDIVWGEGQTHTQRDRNVDGGEDGVGFVEALKPGDRIGLWARAMYPGWRTRVRDATIEVRYSI